MQSHSSTRDLRHSIDRCRPSARLCTFGLQALFALAVAVIAVVVEPARAAENFSVLLIISDDLTSTALSCYGNTLCRTPNIDSLASRGTRFTRAYCQATYCGPSRASLLSGYYPHATGAFGYDSPRPRIGERHTWPELFKHHDYYTARVSKIFHMGVPGGIEDGSDGADDDKSWTERFNSPGPEWKATGSGETLENNPDGKKPAVGGNTFVVVEADGDDLIHSDGKTAAKASELIAAQAANKFWLGVGFVRPHVPFVAPRSYFPAFKPFEHIPLPEPVESDWDDIPKLGINYKTSRNMKMDVRRQKKAIGGYLASVAYMDAQVGKVLAALRNAGLEDSTIVVFTSDHGYHLGEHDFWAKVSLHEESAKVPLIISVPGKQPGVCDSFVELLDLYPTISKLCGLPISENLQGQDISLMLDNPQFVVRDTAFCVAPSHKGFLLREDRWAYIQYGEQGDGGAELYDMFADPKQFRNLATLPEHQSTIERLQVKLAEKLSTIRHNDLGLTVQGF